jgi:hypothetical protein
MYFLTPSLSLFKSYRDEDTEGTCMARLRAASSISYEELKATHIADHQQLFRRTSLQLNGPMFSNTRNINGNEVEEEEEVEDPDHHKESSSQLSSTDINDHHEEEQQQCSNGLLTGVRINRLGQTCEFPASTSSDSKKKKSNENENENKKKKDEKDLRTVQDPSLIAQWFAFSRYLLIASSRPGSQPANLQVCSCCCLFLICL